MITSQVIRSGIRAGLPQPILNTTFKRYRKRSPCDICLWPVETKPCFNIRRVEFEYGNQKHATLVKSFLNSQYWPREPTIVSLWMSLDCPYIQVLTDKYAYSGDRLLAFETVERTNERKLIGCAIGSKVFPWMADELEEWAHFTASKPERYRMYFGAHCLKSPKVFEKYKTPYIYEIEVLATAAEVTGQGVATILLQRVLDDALQLRHPLIQLTATSAYAAKICERCGMKKEWSMDFSDFVDDAGQRVFFPRQPHNKAIIYTKPFNPKEFYEPKECLKKAKENK